MPTRHTRRRLSVGIAILVAIGIGAVLAFWLMRERPDHPLTAHGEPQIVAMDFAAQLRLDALPAGWTHHKFWTRPAMQVSLVTKDSVPALRCETKGGGSILGRWTDIDLGAYPTLSWRWLVETPLSSPLDERTREGDDHPVRFFLGFADSQGGAHHAEIVWGNKLLHRGDWKILGTFVHYVADGGDANVGQWRDESADLIAIYRKASGRNDTPRLTQLGVFCDSDETGGHTVAFVGSPVLLSKVH